MKPPFATWVVRQPHWRPQKAVDFYGSLPGQFVEVADGEPDRSPSWIPTPSPPAMFLGETAPGPNMTRGAQVLLDGRILNVPGLYLMPI